MNDEFHITPRMVEIFKKADPIARKHWKGKPVTVDEMLELKACFDELHASLGNLPVEESPLYVEEETDASFLPEKEQEACLKAKKIRKLLTEEKCVVLH